MHGDLDMGKPIFPTPKFTMNELTKTLRRAGHKKDGPIPPGCREYRDYNGGWTYTYQAIRQLVFETPCGLLTRDGGTGSMSYGGVCWKPENFTTSITCPVYFNGEGCSLVHESLKDCRFGTMQMCGCQLTQRTFDYEQSVDKAHDDIWREAEVKFEDFKAQMGGRICKNHCRYRRAKRQWEFNYDPLKCGQACHNRDFCPVLDKEISKEKGNVYYDIKETWIKKGYGLLPDETIVKIIKGKRHFNRQKSMTICEAIVEAGALQEGLWFKMSVSFVQAESGLVNREIINVRAEKRPSRDLLQDLQDIRDGVEVIHESDSKKAAKAAYQERKIKRSEQAKRKAIRILADESLDSTERYAAARKLAKLKMSYDEIQAAKAEYKQEQEKRKAPIQLDIFSILQEEAREHE